MWKAAVFSVGFYSPKMQDKPYDKTSEKSPTRINQFLKVPFRGFRGDQGLPIQELSTNFEAAVGVEANNYQYNGTEAR